jgi:UDP-glucose 4-epimerase
MIYLVTGGRGCIGCPLTKLLSGLEANVVSYDLSKVRGQSRRNLIQAEGNTLDIPHLQRLQEEHNFDIIVNLAANKFVHECINARTEYFKTNVKAAVNLPTFVSLNEIRVFIHASSAGVYGNQQNGKMSEASPVNPQNYYGETKSLSEAEISRILSGTKVSYTRLCFFNVGRFDSEFVVDKLDVNILPQIAFSLRTNKLSNYSVMISEQLTDLVSAILFTFLMFVSLSNKSQNRCCQELALPLNTTSVPGSKLQC